MIYALMLAAQLSTADISFADAKARADEYESVLSHKDGAALIEAQRQALGAAMKECGPARRSPRTGVWSRGARRSTSRCSPASPYPWRSPWGAMSRAR
mgnify:CR=1 FL=1